MVWGTKGCLTLSRAFAVPPDLPSTLTIEAEGKTDTIAMPKDDHFIKELQYFADGVKDTKIRESWCQEILEQAICLEAIRG